MNASNLYINIATWQMILIIIFSQQKSHKLKLKSYIYYLITNTIYAFAEEIYINLFIAFECIIEYLKLKNSIERKYVIESIEKLLAKNKMSGVDFKSYEEEMRDYIRNDIIHPFRNYIKEQVAQPFMMADYVFEDLGFVDWLFKQLIIGELK